MAHHNHSLVGCGGGFAHSVTRTSDIGITRVCVRQRAHTAQQAAGTVLIIPDEGAFALKVGANGMALRRRMNHLTMNKYTLERTLAQAPHRHKAQGTRHRHNSTE